MPVGRACSFSNPHLQSLKLRAVKFLRVERTLEKQEVFGTKGCNSWSIVSVCEGSIELPTSSIAIATLLVASYSGPAPGRSSRSRSGAAGDARAPAPSTEPRSAHRRCPDPSLSA